MSPGYEPRSVFICHLFNYHLLTLTLRCAGHKGKLKLTSVPALESVRVSDRV